MQESDASNFLKRRGKRSPKSQDEVNASVFSSANEAVGLVNHLQVIKSVSGVNHFREASNRNPSQTTPPQPAENRQKLRADELRREYYEEQRNEFENFVEEQNDEQEERSREAVEQWRQWHYDGLYPSYLYNRHHI
nr:unique cartilage matrix-associated protein isoform X1 [Aotus nancymaae]